jgi:hypothetical protein
MREAAAASEGACYLITQLQLLLSTAHCFVMLQVAASVLGAPQ